MHSSKRRLYVVTFVLIFIVAMTVFVQYILLKRRNVWPNGVDTKSATERFKSLQGELESVGVECSVCDKSVSILLSHDRYLKMAFCPRGIFNIRQNVPELEVNTSKDEYSVKILNDFWIGSTEITQGQWDFVMGKKSTLGTKNDNLPAIDVNWAKANEFVETLNKSIKLPEGWRFALPTEAQWEYACRAGAEIRYNEDRLRKVAWFEPESLGIREVASKLPNAWGIYDMFGNVAEWCSDWHGDEFPCGVDPTGPESGFRKIIKGGAWNDFFDDFIPENRTSAEPSVKGVDLGFRVVLMKSTSVQNSKLKSLP